MSIMAVLYLKRIQSCSESTGEAWNLRFGASILSMVHALPTHVCGGFSRIFFIPQFSACAVVCFIMNLIRGSSVLLKVHRL